MTEEVKQAEQPKAAAMPNVWDDEYLQPQEGENAKQYRAFVDYCGLGGGRSLRKQMQLYRAQIEDKASTSSPPTSRFATLGEWSSKFRWMERAKLYEKLLAHTERQVEMQALKEMKERHIDFAMYLFKIAGLKLQEMALDRSSGLSPAEARQFIETAVRIEREARGAAAAELANAVNDASAVAAGVGGRFRVIEVVKDYGNPNAAEDDDEDDE